MNPVCFVVMPFDGLFDDIYREIYAPAIREAGLEPLRADDIYDNQPIIQDIKQAIRDAALVLAEVSDRNPNVNYGPFRRRSVRLPPHALHTLSFRRNRVGQEADR